MTTCNLGYPSVYGIPGLEMHLGRPYSEVEKDLPRLVSEKEFDKVDEESFFYVPEDDHVLKIVASEPLKKGEQMPYHYGWCSSRFFLINYGFCLPNYPMDAITLKVYYNGEEKIVLLHRDGSQKLFLNLVG